MEIPRLRPEQFIFIREARNLTQEDLAAILGVSQRAISKWENGKSVQSRRYFNITKDTLLLFSGDFQSPPPLQGLPIQISKALNTRLCHILYVQNEIAKYERIISDCDPCETKRIEAHETEISVIRTAANWLIHFANSADWWIKHSPVGASAAGKSTMCDCWESILRWVKIGSGIPIYNPYLEKLYG